MEDNNSLRGSNLGGATIDMSVDDDDDFWANEDFIATIENVVKKAEEASAARHGSIQTQSARATTQPFQIVPPRTSNFRIGETGPLANHGTPPVSLRSQRSGGSIAPARRDAYSGAISSPREDPDTDFRGIPSTGTPQPEVSLHPMNRLGQALIHGRHQSLQYPPAQGGDEFGQLLSEKDGLISVLRSRAQEAEQQLHELRQKTDPQNISHPSVYQQQLELERLSAQLLFKDHEIIEGQRARAEKEERLKNAMAETAALKEELSKLKTSRQTATELKRPRNEGDIDVLEYAWSPPWMPKRIAEAEDNSTTGLRREFLQEAHEVGHCLTPEEKSPIKRHSGGRGGANLDGKHSGKVDKLETNDSHKKDLSRRTGTSVSGRSDGEELPFTYPLNDFSRTCEMYYSLQHLWGIKGVRNDGISLLSELYASCREDLYILFSNRESQVVQGLKSTKREMEGRTNGGEVSENLHKSLAKVANGLAHPETMITPLLEFCKLENVNLVGSALHVLRCLLQHDSTCRQSLLSRGSQDGVDCQVQRFSSCKTLKEAKIPVERGRYIQGAPNEGSNPPAALRVRFSSARIVFHPQEREFIHHERGLAENGTDKGEQGPLMDLDHVQRPLSEHQVAGCDDARVHAEGLNLLVKWMLQLALTTSSPNVKFEAIANIGVMVMNSAPLTERSMFGPLLCHGAIDLLLRESSRAEIQLQAVRIVHLLLHCPAIIQRFFVADEGDESMIRQSKFVNGGDVRTLLENGTGNPPVDSHGQGMADGQTGETSKQAGPNLSPYAQLNKVKLLEALTECLKYTGNSLQGYSLQRSVIRLLAFILAFGESGAATLVQAGASCEDLELGKASIDYAKKQGAGVGESGSGQRIVGDRSGSTHLEDQDLSDKGNGIPIGLVDESVDGSQRAKTVPQRLLALIDSQLDIEEKEEWNEPGIAEERDHLIHEAASLLCRLSSDSVQSSVVIAQLISNKDMARLTLSVTNRLVTRKSYSKQSWAGQMPAAPIISDVADLASILRRCVLSNLGETSPFSFLQ